MDHGDVGVAPLGGELFGVVLRGVLGALQVVDRSAVVTPGGRDLRQLEQRVHHHQVVSPVGLFPDQVRVRVGVRVRVSI